MYEIFLSEKRGAGNAQKLNETFIQTETLKSRSFGRVELLN